MRVLSIGGAGQVGTAIADHLGEEVELTVLDRDPSRATTASVITGDATDPQVLTAAMAGMDAVIYLPAVVVIDPRSADHEQVKAGFDVNVASLHMALRIAEDAGVGSFLHISTGSVYSRIGQERIDVATAVPDATDPYGLTKRLAETVCAAAAEHSAMSITSLRLVYPTTDAAWPSWQSPLEAELRRACRMDDGTVFPALAPADLAGAVEAALHRRGPYAIAMVSGDIDQVAVTGDRTAELLGWRPRRRP